MANSLPPPFDILLAEDEPGDAFLVKTALEKGRFYCRIHHVEDGTQAMAFLRREGEYADAPRPSLMLLDLNMPRMGGREVLREVRADPELRNLPIVVLTTSDVESDVEASYGLGANSFITKPVDLDQFMAAVQAMKEYWFTIVKLPR